MPDDGGPRVFGPGTVTVVVGPSGKTVYAGATELTMVEQVEVDRDSRVVLFMRRPSGDPESLRLDEEVRAAKACPVVVKRL